MVNQQFAFAVHIMTMLAYSGRVVDSRTVAASVNTNPVVVRRLLLALRQAGLVTTRAGKHGGAKLSRKPDRISLLDIYKAVEPRPVISISARNAFKKCPVSCGMKRIMTRVAEDTDDVVRKHLRNISLRQLLRTIR